MNSFSEKVIKFRWLIIVGFILITCFSASYLPKMQMNADALTYLPEDLPSRINRAKIESMFGASDMVMVLIESEDVINPGTLKRAKKISDKLKRIKGIDKVLSLFELKNIKLEDGSVLVDPIVNKIPYTTAQIKDLKNDIIGNDIVYGNVISKDFKMTAIIGMVESGASDHLIVTEINKILAENPGEEKILLGGTTCTRYYTGVYMEEDLGRLLPMGLVIMLLFLLFCFRQLRGMLLPFAVVIMSIIVAMGMIPILGWKLTSITVLLPVILISIANDYGIHMIAKYQEDNTHENNATKLELSKKMVKSLGIPIFITGITTVAGMLCLMGHIVIPAGQLGILAAIGIMFALVASLVFIPAVNSLLINAKPIVSAKELSGKKNLVEKLLTFFGNFVSNNAKGVLLFSLATIVVFLIGITQLKVDTDPIKEYAKDHPVAIASQKINKNLGGFFPISIMVTGDVKDPKIMKKIDTLESKLGQIPEIGNTLSIARVIKQLSRVMNDKTDGRYDKIPDTKQAIAQYIEMYNMSGEPDDFEKLVDFTFTNAQISARIKNSSTPVLRKVLNQIRELTKDDPDVRCIGGVADIFSGLANHVVKGQLIAIASSIILVSLVLMIVFRSFIAGLLGAIPLGLSVIFLFGLMGYLGIELNIINALLSSIMIGVGVDYTIHFLWRYKKERKNSHDHVEAIKHTLLTTGRGIIFNALSVVIGFSILFSSNFVPVKFFGFLIIVSISSCLMGAIIFVPSVCIVFKPDFLEPKIVPKENPSRSIA